MTRRVFSLFYRQACSAFSIDKRFAIVVNVEALLGWLALQAATVEGVPCVGLAVNLCWHSDNVVGFRLCLNDKFCIGQLITLSISEDDSIVVAFTPGGLDGTFGLYHLHALV